jgi:hypothetical protein
MDVETEFLLALGVTIAIETAVLLTGWRYFGVGAPVRWRRLGLAGVLPSALTLPYLWFILPRFVNGPAYLPLGESLVVLAEAPLLAVLLGWSPGRSLLASLLCNSASFLLGPLVLSRLNALLHLPAVGP